jgi:hypothetical protein
MHVNIIQPFFEKVGGEALSRKERFDRKQDG